VEIGVEQKMSDGESCPRPVVRLKVRDRYGAYAVLKFRVDSQADVTAVPISAAEREALPFTKSAAGTVRGIAGRVRKYRDRIRVVIAGKEHDWPCEFTEPAIDPETGRPLPELSPVLGRAGFLGEYAVTIDSGYLIITRIGPIRRWLRQRLQSLWRLTGMVHPPDRAL
jgi:hypothetical protein